MKNHRTVAELAYQNAQRTQRLRAQYAERLHNCPLQRWLDRKELSISNVARRTGRTRSVERVRQMFGDRFLCGLIRFRDFDKKNGPVDETEPSSNVRRSAKRHELWTL